MSFDQNFSISLSLPQSFLLTFPNPSSNHYTISMSFVFYILWVWLFIYMYVRLYSICISLTYFISMRPSSFIHCNWKDLLLLKIQIIYVFWIYWDDYMIFIPLFINVLYHSYWFAYIIPSLHPEIYPIWSWYMILWVCCWLACQFFLENVCVCIQQRC